jgi:phenylacetate-CoA ligase
MSKVLGRSDDMLIIRGVNVFPSQIESVLVQISEVSPHYQIVVDRVDNFDTLEVQVEVSAELFSDEVKKLEALSRRIRAEIQSVLGDRRGRHPCGTQIHRAQRRQSQARDR